MKEGTPPCVPLLSHAHGESLQASLNPQASEFVPSGTSVSAGRAAASSVSATTGRRASALSHQDCRLDAPAPSAKQTRKRSTGGERKSRQHGRAGRREGPPRNGDIRVVHGSAVNESATAVVAMRALGTSARSSSSASLGTNAGAALEKPERRRGGRNASTRNKNGSSEGVVEKQTSGGRARQGRDAPAEQERLMGGYDGDAPCSVHSSATSSAPTKAAVASPAMPHRRPGNSAIDRRRSAASSTGDRAPDGSTAQGRRRGTPSGAPATAVATSSVRPAGQAYHGERARKKSDQRRRRPHDMREDLADARVGGDPQRAPRPRRAARASEAPRPSAFRNGISDCRPLGQAPLAAGIGAHSSVEKDAEGTTAGRPKSFRKVAPSRGSSGRGPEAGSGSPPSSALLLTSTVEDDREEEKEDFPALPPASGRRTAPLAPSSSSHRLPPPPPLEASAAGTSSALDYSSLTDRLAAEAAAAEAAKLAGPGNGLPGEGFLHLSVLPGFGDRPGDKPALRGKNSGPPESPDSRSQVVQTPASRPTGAEDGGGVSARTLSSTPSVLQPPSPPQRPTLAASTGGKRRVGAAAATIALRARLRERWFRLEAVRKAQRQREASERGHMATEDDKPTGHRHHEDGQGRKGGDNGEESRGVGAQQGLRSRAQDSGSVDDCSSSCDSSDSGGGGGSGDGGNEGAGDIDTATEGRSNSVCVSLASPTTPPEGSTATARASCGPEIYDPSKSNVSDARVFTDPSEAPRAISVAGIAAIRRSELAAAASVHRSVPAENIATRPKTRVEAKIGDITGPALFHDKRSETGGGDVEREASGYCSSGSCGDSGEPSGPGERAHAACEAGMAGLLNDILVRSGGRAADGKDKLRRTPLHLAAEAGALECVNLLLKHGTRLDQRDRWRETPLHKAARSGNPGVVKALCAARMKVNVRNRHRETPLLLAVRAGSAGAVAALLASGARLDEPDASGITPVCQAAMSGQAELLMIMANSNQACRKSNRESAASHTIIPTSERAGNGRAGTVARRRGPPSYLHRTRETPPTGGSKGRGGGGNLVPVPPLSPVHEAAATGHVETLSLLLQFGSSLEERDTASGVAGDTPLSRSVREGQLDCARVLLDAGAMIGRENARGETPLVVAIRAGQASAVELLAQRGASLDGGGSTGRLTGANGRAPAGAREKMMARRRVEPLELAMREGQLACAAVLIEGGARISERALRAVKLEPAMASATGKSPSQGFSVVYAGTSGHGGTGRGAGGSSSAVATSTTAVATLPLQTDMLECMSPEIADITESAPLNGGGLEEDPSSQGGFDDREALLHGGSGSWLDRPKTEGGDTERVGGLLPALGEFDVVLILEDGSRLPAHSCLLASFSGTFRDLFLGRRGHHHGRDNRKSNGTAGFSTLGEDFAAVGDRAPIAAAECVREDEQLISRARDVQALLEWREAPGKGSRSGATLKKRPPPAPAPVAAVAVAVAAAAVASLKPRSPVEDDARRRQQPPAVFAKWGAGRGEVHVRFWGPGTMAAVVRHVYTGRPPTEVHADGLARLLSASASLRMPRLMRQVEHLLAATLAQQRTGARSAQHEEAARLLRGARALGAADLEDRCTLYLQANGVFPAVMKLRRELGIPSLNSSDVARGLARLNGSGYLGSGPAHAWSSSDAAPTSSASAAAAAVAAAKRGVDLSLRKRAVDFDQLVPLLLDTARCLSTLFTGYPERAVLLTAALAEACPGGTPGGFPRDTKHRNRTAPFPSQRRRRGRQTACGSEGGVRDCPSVCGDTSAADKPPVPLASNFSAFSHGMGWLLRTGAVADVALVLPVRPGGAEAGSMVEHGVEEGEEEEEEREADQYRGASIQDAAGVTGGACGKDNRVDAHRSGVRRRADGGGRGGAHGSGVQQRDGVAESDRQLLGEELPGCGEERGRRAAPKAKRTQKSKMEPPRFMAHSLVLGARSEKFAAMLRFVRRQDGDGGLDPSDAAADDGGNSSSSSGDGFGGDNGDDYEHSRCFGSCGIHGGSNGDRGGGGSGGGGGSCGGGSGGGGSDGSGGGGNADAVQKTVETSGRTLPEEGATSGDRDTSSDGMEQGEAADPKLDQFLGLQEEDRGTGVDPAHNRRSPGGVCACRRRRHHRLRRDLPPRVLELHSPLLSRRSLGLFLEFLYTGVLDPGLSAGELSELALVADEYLVPDLTQQVETLLVERLAPRSAGGDAIYTCSATGEPMPGVSSSIDGKGEEDTASIPLEVLQLGASLGLPDLSAAAARAVLLQLETVSRSEAFEASGMTKRELVVAALEAATA